MTSSTESPPRHRNAVLVQRMRAALDDAGGAGLSSMSNEELCDYIADLEGLVAQAKAELLSAVREADRRDPHGSTEPQAHPQPPHQKLTHPGRDHLQGQGRPRT